NHLAPIAATANVSMPARFWLNGMQASFAAAVTAAVVYVVTALLTSRRDFNLNRMLHRGAYAVAADHDLAKPLSMRQRFTFRNIFKFDDNFTRTDKIVVG